VAVTKTADVASQIPQLWATDLYSQAENMTFWQKFEGPEGSDMPIIRKDDLAQQAGDTIKYDIVLALTGAGATGDAALLEGNEEAMKFRQQSVAVESLQHAVRWSKKGKILFNHNMRTTGLNQLRKWLAGKIDDANFKEFSGTGAATMPTLAKWFAGTATSIATVDDTDAAGRLKLNDLSDIKAFARVQHKIQPIRLENGEEYYGLVAHDYALLALRKDANFQQAAREARERSATNPLFTGASIVWDGVIMYPSPRVITAADGVGAKSVARNIFFGAQAMCRGYAYYPDWTEQYFSYGQEQGIATFLIKGEKLNVFDLTSGGGAAAVDFTAIGSMVLYSSAVAPVA
jgi:N4-gp56 family major capsid protein